MYPSSFSSPSSSGYSGYSGYPGVSSSSSSSGGIDPSERSQILIRIKNAKVNYAKVIEKIDFRPYMLDLPPPAASSSSSASPRMAIYLPDTHNVHVVFEKYVKLYKGVIGSPALVFVDRKAYSDYILYARELIKKNTASAASTTPGPHALVDSDKIRMINNNITFIVNLLFQNNRIIVTGNKNDQIQVTVADKPVIVSQSYYLDTYNKDEISYSSTTPTVKKYESGDKIIVEKEKEASDLKKEIDDLKVIRKTTEQKWIEAKDEYKKNSSPSNLDAVDKARDEYNQALDNENEKAVERSKLVSEINQLRYGSKEVVSILEKLERDSRPIEEKERNKIVLEKEIDLLEKKAKLMEDTQIKIRDEIIRELIDIFETVFLVTKDEMDNIITKDIPPSKMDVVLEAKLATKVEETRAEIKRFRGEEDDNDNNTLLSRDVEKIEQYITRMKSVDKLKKGLEAIEGKSTKLAIGSFSQNPYSRDSIMYVRYELKTKESEKKKVEEQLTELKYKQKREELRLENYTLRVYVYELKGVSLVSKYLSNGKKNQQFVLLQRKGYGVRGSSEYQKNADKLIRDAPMFSAASCLQQKTDIQNMFDNIILSTKEKIKDTLDQQQSGGGKGDGTGKEDGDENREGSSKPDTKQRLIESYKKFSMSKLLFDPEEAYVSKQPPTKKCRGSIHDREDDTESKLIQSVKIKMGTYPPFLIPQTFYKMHKVSYYPPIPDDVDMKCNPPPPELCNATIYNLDMLLYPSDIQVAFPSINTTADSIKYTDTIQKQHKFKNMGIIVGSNDEDF